jgi:hypothetical protein
MRALATLTAILIAGSAGHSHAVEPAAIFERYAAMWQQLGMSAGYGSVEADGASGVIFRDVTLQQPGKAALKLDRLAMKGIEPVGSDGFSAQNVEIGQVTLDATDEKGRALSMRMDGGTASGLYLPPTGSIDPMVSRAMPYSIALGKVTASVDGAPAFTVSGIAGTMGYDASGQTVAITSSIGQIDVSTERASPKLRGQLGAAGLTQLSLSMSLRGSWNMETGRMALDEFRLAAKDAGAVSLSLALEGYTPQISQKMQEVARSRKTIDPNDAEAKKQLSARMMELLGQLQLSSARIEFEDGAVTRRLLATQAEAMGIAPEELAASLPAMLGGYLAMAGNQQFSDQAISALGAFLANPEKLTLSLRPAQPLQITQLVEAILNAPESIVPLLGAKVTANQ